MITADIFGSMYVGILIATGNLLYLEGRTLFHFYVGLYKYNVRNCVAETRSGIRSPDNTPLRPPPARLIAGMPARQSYFKNPVTARASYNTNTKDTRTGHSHPRAVQSDFWRPVPY